MFNSPITFKEASDALSSRLPEATALKYREIMAQWSPGARQRAFFSARVADATLLSEIRSRVQAVVNGAMTNRQAVRLLRESFAGENADVLAALGFAPKRDAQGIAQLASIPRLKLVMDTNVRLAQECGHYRQWEAVKEFYPIGVWHCGYSEVHRREHLARDGKAFAFDHPIWTQSPPGGEFNCHCWRENMTAEAAARRGIVPQPEDFPFVPSSLGFDPSRPLDDSTVKPGERVLPEFAQKAEDAKCPDDVLKDMAGEAEKTMKDIQTERLEAIPGVQKVDFDGWEDEEGIKAVADRMEELYQKYDVPPPFSRFVIEPIEGRNGSMDTVAGVSWRKSDDTGVAGQISLNINVLNQIPEWREKYDTDIDGTYIGFGSYTIKGEEAVGVATHEFGHRIISRFIERGDLHQVADYINMVYKQHLSYMDRFGNMRTVVADISQYAATNWEEFWAEAFKVYSSKNKERLPADIRYMVGNVLSCIRKDMEQMPMSRLSVIADNFRKEYKRLAKGHMSIDLFGRK